MEKSVNRIILQVTSCVGLSAVLTFSLPGLVTARYHPSLAAVAYGVSLFCCCLFSLLYNVIERQPMRQLLRLLDHSAIFLLIAGTATPFITPDITGLFGLKLLTWIWLLAVIGIVLKLTLRYRYEGFFVLFYLGLGWLFASTIVDLVRTTPSLPLILLIMGGLPYSIGAFIYWRGIGRWTDSVWHGCVLAGILLHFGAVFSLMEVAPIA